MMDHKVRLKGYLFAAFILAFVGGLPAAGFFFKHLWYEGSVIAQSPRIGQYFLLSIAALTLLSMLTLIKAFLRYQREEFAIYKVLKNLRGHDHPLEDVRQSALIKQRYSALADLNERESPMDQGALSAILSVRESACTSFASFVQTILVLLGVFGTVVSLGYSLTGASELMGSTKSLQGMSGLMSGLATALSTTMVAIVSFIIHSFFLQAFGHYQKAILAEIERMTLVYLIPHIDTSPQDPESKLVELIATLKSMVDELRNSQVEVSHMQKSLSDMMNASQVELSGFTLGVQSINQTLKAGFRLDESQGTH